MNFKPENFVRIFVPFALTQILGIFVAHKFLPSLGPVEAQGFSAFNVLDFIILALFIFLIVFLATKFQRAGSILFKIFFAVIVFSGVQAVASIWFAPIIATLLALWAAVLVLFFNNAIIQNLVMVITLAGVGAAFGLSLTPVTIVWILVIMSFYDIVAVYKTGHMIKLAEAMIRSHAIFGFVVPEEGRSHTEKIANITPGQGFMILGSGDVIFPLLLSASLVRYSIKQSLLVGFFSLLGLFLMHLIFNNQKVRKPMAALPPIVAITIIGYLFSLILF